MIREIETRQGSIRLFRRPAPDLLAGMAVEEGLGSAFRRKPDVLKANLQRVASLEQAELVVAWTSEGRMVGYLLLLPPGPLERWGRDPALPLHELVALEVARPFRRLGIAKGMLGLAFSAGTWEERIALAPLYASQWDGEGNALDPRRYRRMLLVLFWRFGFAEFPTDDPEILADPSNLLLVRVGRQVPPEIYLRFSALLTEGEAASIRELNLLERPERERIYGRLIPPEVFETFRIDPSTLTDRLGRKLVEFICPPDQEMVRIEVRREPEDQDCLYLLKLDRTFDADLELAFIVINDLRAQRFHIDRDEAGRDTRMGTAARNLPEEARAMQAGLAPGQVRRGLSLFGKALLLVEGFAAYLGRDRFVLEPNFYHVAILCEKRGLGYLVGREAMDRIHEAFQPGGTLFRRLDGSTPLRRRGMEGTARGRSWAIQDGILGEPWRLPRMYKRVGIHAGISTFPDAVY